MSCIVNSYEAVGLFSQHLCMLWHFSVLIVYIVLLRHRSLTCDNCVFSDWLLRMYDLLVGSMHDDSLSALMNGPIRKKLGIIPTHVTWGGMLCTELFSWLFVSN